MSNSQEEVTLTRDVIATLIPHGEEFTLGSGEKVTITHRLGGNFTVMTLQGMYRIAARDADALGEINDDATKQSKQSGANRRLKTKFVKILKAFLIPRYQSM